MKKSLQKIPGKGTIVLVAVVFSFLMIGSAYGTVGFEKVPQSSINGNIQVVGLQSEMKYLYSRAGQTLTFSLGGNTDVTAQISNVVDRNVSVSFTTTFGNDTIYSTSIIHKGHQQYYLEAVNSATATLASYDPGGPYSYYVGSDGVGAGAQTWEYWYVEHPFEPGWSSTSTSDAPTGTFYISWQAPFLIFILDLPETLIDWGWSASNGAGWGPYGNGTLTENDGTGGSNTLYNYFGYSTTVNIDITWTYFGGV